MRTVPGHLPAQLVLSVGVILLIVTSQGWQNALQKADPLILDSGDTVHR